MINIYKLYNTGREFNNSNNRESILGTYNVIEINGGIQIDLDLSKCYVNKTYSVKLMYNDWAGKIAQIRILDTYIRMDLKVMEVFKFISNKIYQDNNSSRWPDANILKVFFNEDCSKIMILIVQSALEENKSLLEKYSVELLDRSKKSGTEWMIEKSEYFKSVIEKRKIKTEVIVNTDIYNSISYLEGQLDAVTKLLLKVIEKYNIDLSDTDISNAMLITSKANEYSILNIKPIDKILEEFNNKKEMRELQKKYYEEKNKLIESTSK